MDDFYDGEEVLYNTCVQIAKPLTMYIHLNFVLTYLYSNTYIYIYIYIYIYTILSNMLSNYYI